MKFLLFETTTPSLTAKRLAPSPTDASSSHSESTESTCSTDHADDASLWSTDDDDQAIEIEWDERKVRFADPSQNISHENTVSTRDQVRALWYNKNDFLNFRRNTLEEAQAVLQSPESKPVIDALGQAYTGFCSAQNQADILTVLATTHIPCLANPQYIGMDRFLIKALVVDRSNRKRRLLGEMTWWQVHREGHPQLSTQLRRASRSASQPSRLYAHHVAQCALRSEADE